MFAWHHWLLHMKVSSKKLSTFESLVVSFIPQLLQPWGNSHHYPLNRRQGRLQSQPGCYGEDRNLPLLGIEPQSLQLLSPWLSRCTLYWGSHPDQSYHHICSDCFPTIFCMSSLTCYFQLVCPLTAYLFLVFIFDVLKVILSHLRIQLFWAVPLCPWVSICSHSKSHLALTFNVHHSHSVWQGHCLGEGRGVGVKQPSHVAESKQQQSGWQNAYFRWKNLILCTQPNLDYWAKQKATQ